MHKIREGVGLIEGRICEIIRGKECLRLVNWIVKREKTIG